MVEFAFVLPLVLLLTVVLLQMILILAAALAVQQAAASSARYAAVNPTYDQSAINSYLHNVASPVINDTYLAPIAVSPGATPRTSGAPVTVTVSYSLTGKLILGSSFMGVVMPRTLAVSETMISE